MRSKIRRAVRMIAPLIGQVLTRTRKGSSRARRRQTLRQADVRGLVVGIALAVLPGCAFLTFVDEQDTGTFVVSERGCDDKQEAGTALPADVSVEVETATWWATEVLIRVRIENESPESLALALPETTLTFVEPIRTHYVRTPAYSAPGDACLLAGIGLQIERGDWQRVRPFGDVEATRHAAELKAPMPNDAFAIPFIVPPGKAATIELEFEAPCMHIGAFALGLTPSGDAQPSLLRFDLQRPRPRTTRACGK